MDGMEKLWWRSALRVIYSSTCSCSALLAVTSPQRFLCVSFSAREAQLADVPFMEVGSARHTGEAELSPDGSPAKLTSQEGSQQVARRHTTFLTPSVTTLPAAPVIRSQPTRHPTEGLHVWWERSGWDGEVVVKKRPKPAKVSVTSLHK